MELSQQVASLELCKKLKHLGVKQESIFWHGTNWKGENIIGYVGFANPQKYVKETAFSAFSVAELGELLPDNVFSQKDCGSLPVSWSCDNNEYISIEETEANARAVMLIYLIENNVIKSCSVQTQDDQP